MVKVIQKHWIRTNRMTDKVIQQWVMVRVIQQSQIRMMRMMVKVIQQ